MDLGLIAIIILWWGLIAYAVLGGADFGAGVWDLFADRALRQRNHDFINRALGPVWEANHVWLIFLIVGLFTLFPPAFEALSIALFFPLGLALIGIVLRGAAFIFRYYAMDAQGPFARAWGWVFSVSSLLTPFFLGSAAAAVASGQLDTPAGAVQVNLGSAWTTPFALTIGAMAVALCSVLAAVYLTVEAKQANDQEMLELYRTRALISGAITAILGAIGLALSPSEAPLLWQGMLERALPIVIATMLIGLGAAAALWYRKYALARVLVILEAAFMLGSWGLSQFPYIIPPHFTIDNSANLPSVIMAFLISGVIGMAILLPSLYYLFSVFKLSTPAPGKTEE